MYIESQPWAQKDDQPLAQMINHGAQAEGREINGVLCRRLLYTRNVVQKDWPTAAV